MKNINMKKDEVEFLKRNWKTLTASAKTVVNETLDFVMATVEKDLDMVIDRTNKAVVGVNGWLQQKQENMHKNFVKAEEAIEKELEVSRMEDEGGAGFINTLPHETSPTETSNASEHHH